VIGLDLGGTNSVFGIVDADANVIASTSIRTAEQKDLNVYIANCCKALEPLIEKVGGIQKIKGLGIGAPNGNYYTGNIEQAPNLPWKGIVPLAKLFHERLGIPVVLTNDANAAAIGEMTYGVAKGMKDFIMLTLGTGVGSGIVVNGELVYGCDGFAGELGHVIVDTSPDARLCGCGRKGCLETYCSATGVARTARAFLSKHVEDSELRKIPAEEITSKDVSITAEHGDAMAREIYKYTGHILGRACANFTAFSSPEAYVFFGGLTKAGNLIMDPIKEAYNENVQNIFKGKAKMLISQLDDAQAAVLGAAALAWKL
ncbi:MAG: ROK family protein, partial [Paraprevotella sp.]|nr:ROK family protein [Paraprevotella sp.]